MSPPVLDRSRAAVAPDRQPRARTRPFALPEVRWATVATVLFVFGLAAQFGGAPAWLWWVLYLACYVTGGWEPALAGLQALRAKSLDVDLLMIVAAIGAAAIGQVLDGGLLIVIFATSGALEAFATQRTADSVRSLLDLAPEQATVITESGDETVVDAATLRSGTSSWCAPVSGSARDGQVVSGASDVDQATITGEPLPVAKNPGDEVFAGTLNGTGVLRIRVDRAAADTVVARIVAMVRGGFGHQGQAPAVHREGRAALLDRGMVTATLLVFAVPLRAGRRVAAGAAARDDLHDRRVAVRGGAGDHAAAAGRDGQRRTQRRPGQIRSRDGTTWLDHGRARSTRPAPSPRAHPN